MKELLLTHEAPGLFRSRTKLDLELANENYRVGETVRAKVTHLRSVRQNNLFHALCEIAFDNQRGGPLLPTWKHLKHWLLIQEGHCMVKRFQPGAMKPEVAAALRSVYDDCDFTTDGSSIVMRVAKSVSFTKAEWDVFQPVMNRVVERICTEIVPGTTPDQLMDMAKNRVQ